MSKSEEEFQDDAPEASLCDSADTDKPSRVFTLSVMPTAPLMHVPGVENQGEQGFSKRATPEPCKVAGECVNPDITSPVLEDGNIWITVPLDDPKGTMLKCMLDTGSQRSFINSDYVHKLNLQVHSVPLVTLQCANGTKEGCTLATNVCIRINPSAPPKSVDLLVTKHTPPGDYCLVGTDVIIGYSIAYSSPPVVEWISSPPEALVVDPYLPPEPKFESDTTKPSSLIVFGDFLSDQECSKLKDLVDSYADVFGPLNEHPCTFGEFHVDLLEGTVLPIRSATRYVAADRRAFIKSEITRLLELGVIRPSTSENASPITIAHKRGGKFRMCIDYTMLNQATVRDAFPIPSLCQMFDFIRAKPYLAAWDLTSAYHQFRVAKSSIGLLAFTTPEGLFEPTRLPFGVKNGPPFFQRETSSWLQREGMDGFMKSFFDDLVTACETFKTFFEAISKFLQKCREANLKLSAEKCHLGHSRLHYLGRLVGPDGIAVDPERLEPLKNAFPPKERKTLRSFLGLAQWFSPFIPSLATLADPLWNLIKKDVKWDWNSECQAAWKRVIQAILNAPILEHVITGSTSILVPDASGIGIGGALLQEEPKSKKLGLLSFFARKLIPAEQRYCTLELEALAIIYGLVYCRGLITGPLVIRTDHSNLQWIHNTVNHRVQRWALLLNEYDYVVEYHPGKTNFIADYLSRAFNHEEGDLPPKIQVCAVIFDLGREVETLRALVLNLPHQVHGSVLVLDSAPTSNIIDKIFALCHGNVLAGHGGVQRTLFSIRSTIEWKGMKEDIRKRVLTCPVCQKLRAQAVIPTQMYTTMSLAPFDSIFVDFIGPLREDHGFKYILNIIDRFSRYLVLTPCMDTEAKTAVHALYFDWICFFGIPKLITSDGGSCFTARLWKQVINDLRIKHHVSAPYHPEGHGAVERSNRTVGQTIRALFYKQTEWVPLVKPAAFAINTSYSRMIGTTPFNVVHGFSPRLLVHSALASDAPSGLADEDFDPFGFYQKLIPQAAKLSTKVQDLQNAEYEKMLKEQRTKARGQAVFHPGDYVLVHFPRSEKLAMDWQGPYLVEQKENEVIYILSSLAPDHAQMRCHVNRMHIYWPGNLTSQQLQAESAAIDEYYVEKVFRDEVRNGERWFFVQWMGYPPAEDIPDNWVRYSDCKHDVKIKEYVAAHHLSGGRQ